MEVFTVKGTVPECRGKHVEYALPMDNLEGFKAWQKRVGNSTKIDRGTIRVRGVFALGEPGDTVLHEVGTQGNKLRAIKTTVIAKRRI